MLKLQKPPAKPSSSTTNPPVIGPASSPASAARPHQRRCISRSQYLRPAALRSAQRSALVDETYAVYREQVGGWTRDEFEAEVINTGQRLVLYYGADDELAGFSSLRIERVFAGGRTRAVMCSFVYFRPGYRGGASAFFFGFRHALLFRLHEPRTPLDYLTRSSSPAVYRLLASTASRVYPSPERTTPSAVEELVRVVSTRRHYVTVGENPWVVRSAAIPRDAARLVRIQDDPRVRYYTEINPRFAEGQALLTLMPVDAANVAGTLLRAVRRALKISSSH
jgi:hypothetical protein